MCEKGLATDTRVARVNAFFAAYIMEEKRKPLDQ